MDSHLIPHKFDDVNWDVSFDLATHQSVVSPAATIKSIFVRDLLVQAQRRHVVLKVDEDHLRGKDYPLRAYMSLLVEASRAFYPGLVVRQALRQLGRTVFPTFVESLVGRVMLGVMGTDVVAIMRLANKAAAASISVGRAATLTAGPGESVLHLQGVYFSDTYQIGVFEGMLEATKKQMARVRLHKNALDDVFVQITWREANQRSVVSSDRNSR